jgi:hypothetical protein
VEGILFRGEIINQPKNLHFLLSLSFCTFYTSANDKTNGVNEKRAGKLTIYTYIKNMGEELQ